MTWLIIGAVVLLFGFVVLFGAPYVPSQRRYVRRLFGHLQLGSDDVVVDLGSGDGVVLRIARTFGARAVGYELNPLLWVVTRLLSLGDSKLEVRLANAWTATFPDDTTVVYIFSVGRDERRLMKTVEREAARLRRPLTLVCLGNPLKGRTADDSFEAYHIYRVEPSHRKSLTV